jgi:hypothetical protein
MSQDIWNTAQDPPQLSDHKRYGFSKANSRLPPLLRARDSGRTPTKPH